MSDHEERNRPEYEPLDALLASDQARLRKVTEERAASGMFARVAEAHRRQKRGVAVSGWAAAITLAAAGLAVALWPGRPPRPLPPGVAKDLPQKAAGPSEAGVQKTPASQAGVKIARSLKQAQKQAGRSPVTARSVTPRQSVFPGNTEPTEQERLLMTLARSDLTREDKQLPEIAKAISVQVEQEKGQRQAFEKWLQEGGEK